jgi:predicted esterase
LSGLSQKFRMPAMSALMYHVQFKSCLTKLASTLRRNMEKSAHDSTCHFTDGRLCTRTALPTIESELVVGTHKLTFANGRNAQFHVPAGYDKRVLAPLVVIFHGASGQDGGAVAIATEWADRHGAFLIAQKSIASTWDILRGGYGPDVAFIRFLLDWTMQRYAINPSRIGIAGFSDGGSYALSVGLMNGDLFHDILAFSAGFARPLSRTGLPRIFIAHGKDDPILPVECGRRIAQQLSTDGYDVQYHEFNGGHYVPRHIAEAAMNRFVS